MLILETSPVYTGRIGSSIRLGRVEFEVPNFPLGVTTMTHNDESVDPSLYPLSMRKMWKPKATTKLLTAGQANKIVDALIRGNADERRRILSRFRWDTPAADLEKITRRLITELRQAESNDLRTVLMWILAEIGPNLLLLGCGSGMPPQTVVQASGIIVAIALKAKKMNPIERCLSLTQLKWASDLLDPGDTEWQMAVKNIVNKILQASKPSPAGK